MIRRNDYYYRKTKKQTLVIRMRFLHCQICVALAFFTFCVVVTRNYMFLLLFKESAKNRNEKDYSSTKFKYLLS